MSNHDIVLGLGQATLSGWVGRLYANPTVRQALHIKRESFGFTLEADVISAPTLVLQPPPQDKWRDAYVATGVDELPPDNTFQVHFSSLLLDVPDGEDARVVEAELYVRVELLGDELCFSLLALWFDASPFNLVARLVFTRGLPWLLARANDGRALSFKLPPVEWLPVGAPLVAIVESRLVVAFIAPSSGEIDISGVTWPQREAFVLASRSILDAALRRLLEGLRGKELGASAAQAKAGAGYTLTLEDATAVVGVEALNRLDCSAQLSASVRTGGSVGVSYDIRTTPRRIGLALEISASGANIAIRVLDVRSFTAALTPGAGLSRILSALAWPLLQPLGLAFPLLARILRQRKPIVLLEPIPVVPIIDAPSIQVNAVPSGIGISSHQGMLLLEGTIDLVVTGQLTTSPQPATDAPRDAAEKEMLETIAREVRRHEATAKGASQNQPTPEEQ